MFCSSVIFLSLLLEKYIFLVVEALPYRNNDNHHLFGRDGNNTLHSLSHLSYRKIVSLIEDVTCTEIIVQDRRCKRLQNGVRAMHQGNS